MRLLSLLLFVLLLCAGWSVLGQQPELQGMKQNIESKITAFKENPDVSVALDDIVYGFNQLIAQLNSAVEQIPGNKSDQEYETLAKPDLTASDKQVFTIYNITIGDSRQKVEKQLGAPKRSTSNEYGTKWHAYHKNYQHFLMVSYDENNKVAGLYTNQDLIASTKGIKLGTAKGTVHKQLGDPLTRMRKGLVYYQLEENSEYDLYKMNGNYVTIFYDKHEKNTLTSMQIISETLENDKKSLYTNGTQQMKEGFEYQLFDVTNASRVNHNLPVLQWSPEVQVTARGHSADMAKNNYFNHTNQQGQSPFDRMEEDKLVFTTAGENLAAGQFSSIFAHEGLMNSLGHRKNILNDGFEYLGVGVAFGADSRPYYTENFYAN
ncbi:CAP domain-containing protein [Peribacillus sp. SCS-155]|uniref:CAP domain-containing protein n=1 Tax=Peribacillus sedimenti TaxID=3115297 RepID=UPI00390649BD